MNEIKDIKKMFAVLDKRGFCGWCGKEISRHQMWCSDKCKQDYKNEPEDSEVFNDPR